MRHHGIIKPGAAWTSARQCLGSFAVLLKFNFLFSGRYLDIYYLLTSLHVNS